MRRLRLFATLLVALLALAACGGTDDADSEPTTTSATSPQQVDESGQDGVSDQSVPDSQTPGPGVPGAP